MSTVRRVLACGHVQRISTPAWRRATDEARREMFCRRCGAVMVVTGKVPDARLATEP